MQVDWTGLQHLLYNPGSCCGGWQAACLVGQTVILLHRSLPVVGASIVMGRERQHNASLVNG